MDSKKVWSFWFPMGHCCQTLDEFVTEFHVPADFRADKGWDSWSMARLKFDQWIVNDVSLTFSWIKRSLAILLLLLQGVIGVTCCFLRDHLIHQEDPFQSLGSPEDLEEMGDQPPPPNTARFLTESEGLDSTVLSWSSLAICTISSSNLNHDESWFHRQMS